MNERLLKRLADELSRKTGGRVIKCGICGGTRWRSDGFTNLPIQPEVSNVVHLGGKIMPVFILCCELCGNILNFNAILLLGGKDNYEREILECRTDRGAPTLRN
jgi:hypothetical protein